MRRTIFLLAALAACGDSNKNNPDASPDAPTDATPPACDFTEAADGTNAQQAEATGVMIGAVAKNLCGSVDPGHFDAITKAVDVDAFRVTLAAPSELLVRFFGAPGTEAFSDFTVLVFDVQPNPTLLNGASYNATLGDHGVFASSLPAGTFDIVVTAKGTAAATAAVEYKVRIEADAPATRCAQVTAPATYTEALDTASNLGNDVVDVDFSKPTNFTLTTATTDAAEPTGLTLDATTPARITGSSASVSGPDQYADRDTFQLMTGGTTDELALRVNWPAGGADLDAIVFAENTMVATGSVTRSGTSGDTFVTFAVKPGTSYWLWVGNLKGGTGLPVAYDASLCGTAVTPAF